MRIPIRKQSPAKRDVDVPLGYWPYQRAFFPFAFAVEDQHLHSLWGGDDDGPDALLAWDDGATRDVPVFSSHRPHAPTYEGGRANATRWLRELAIPGALVGDVDQGSRFGGGARYWAGLKRAQIVVTANPSKWEGDFRLWEALASKALVFVDHLYAPMPCPLIDGQDVIYFHPYDQADFVKKLEYYLAHPEEARRIAMSGFHKVRKKGAVCPRCVGSNAAAHVLVQSPSTHFVRCRRPFNAIAGSTASTI